MTDILFSVVLPTYNRRDALIRCLRSIDASAFDHTRFEVIVVNDGGSAVDDVAHLPDLATLRVRIASQQNRGPAAARNLGATLSRGRYLAFIDDDCIASKDWLAKLEEAVARFPRRMIGGKTVNLLRDNAFSQASQCLVDYVYKYYNDSEVDRTRFFASNNLAVDARMFAESGGFDESFRSAEDRDFCRAWKARGWDFHYAPDVIIQHAHHLTLASLQKQHFGYGRGALPYWKKGATQNSTRFKVEPLAFYSGMLMHPFSQHVPHAAAIAALILVSQVSNAAGFAYEAARSLVRKRNIATAAHRTAHV